jgi:2-polyprenyl-3-methyl-5-hydroxy-6-metoxy-1,4-benzoquinol methylase
MDYNLDSDNIQNYFKKIYEDRSWCDQSLNEDFSVSGNGSRISTTNNLRKELKQLILKYNIKTIVDCGCGDFKYLSEMNDFLYDNLDAYIGIDVVEELINTNNEKYGNSKIKFICQDISETSLQNADLVICKEVLIHLPKNKCINFFNNIKKGTKYILTSSYRKFCEPYKSMNNTQNGYYHFKLGACYCLRLFEEPYNFPGPLETITEVDGNNDKKLYMWEASDIPDLEE